MSANFLKLYATDSLSLPGVGPGSGSVWTILIVWFLVAVLALLVHNRTASRSEARKGADDDDAGGRERDGDSPIM